jgi:hypothetical protein
VLTPLELYTCLLEVEVGILVNQRPIGRIPNDPDSGSYICPNNIVRTINIRSPARSFVMYSDDNTIRGKWMLGRIVKVYPGGRRHDSICHSAKYCVYTLFCHDPLNVIFDFSVVQVIIIAYYIFTSGY